MKKAVCMVTACLVLGQTMPVYAQGTSWIDQVEITAHRGDSLKALENTLPAFEKAIESGSDWIELDVNETKDNVPVVFHDCNLKRIMGKDAKIRDLTLRDGQQSSFATRMTQAQIDRCLPYYKDANFYAMEVWGGAVPDSVMRYLNETRGRGSKRSTKPWAAYRN